MSVQIVQSLWQLMACWHSLAFVLSLYQQVKAAVLNPEDNFNIERTLTKEDVQKLIYVRLANH